MVVDALDLCYTKSHVDTFVIVSGDSDFSPLVSKLRENNKIVIGVGVKSSTSDLLIANCDEFIFYDDLVRRAGAARRPQAGAREAVGVETGAERAGGGEPVRARACACGGRACGAGAAKHRGRAAAGSLRPRAGDDRGALRGTRRGREDLGLDDQAGDQASRPGFNESYHGFRSFSELLEEARARHLIELEKDEKSGGYVVRAVN